MTTFKSLQEETNSYIGTLVLDANGQMALFRGVIEEPDDYYYKYIYFGQTKVTLFSCCGWIIPLKGKIGKGEYECLLSYWNHNNPKRKAI